MAGIFYLTLPSCAAFRQPSFFASPLVVESTLGRVVPWCFRLFAPKWPLESSWTLTD